MNKSRVSCRIATRLSRLIRFEEMLLHGFDPLSRGSKRKAEMSKTQRCSAKRSSTVREAKF